MSHTQAFSNVILKLLKPESIHRLKLVEVNLPAEHLLERAGRPLRSIYFLEAGLASSTTLFENGHKVDVCLLGNEAVIGTAALMGWTQAAYDTIMRIEGRGYKAALSDAMSEFCLHGRFHEITLRYVQMQFMHAMQTSACNATHDVDHRLAGWLLLCCERTGCDSIPLTHEFFGEMLGIRRSTVSLSAENLQRQGVISYRRGEVRVNDRVALEKSACECYRLMRQQLLDYCGKAESVVLQR
jgi:CRP-like cAMP-binding protein